MTAQWSKLDQKNFQWWIIILVIAVIGFIVFGIVYLRADDGIFISNVKIEVKRICPNGGRFIGERTIEIMLNDLQPAFIGITKIQASELEAGDVFYADIYLTSMMSPNNKGPIILLINKSKAGGKQ